VFYRPDTGSVAVDFVAIGKQPPGLVVWLQPGRYDLRHAGNLRTARLSVPRCQRPAPRRNALGVSPYWRRSARVKDAGSE